MNTTIKNRSFFLIETFFYALVLFIFSKKKKRKLNVSIFRKHSSLKIFMENNFTSDNKCLPKCFEGSHCTQCPIKNVNCLQENATLNMMQ